jgi:hypothetical protein
MTWLRSPFSWFLIAVLTAAGLVAIGPRESSLGENVRLVYLHGAWVMTAEIVLALAALTGLAGILFHRARHHRLSAALGRTGIIFWIITLPLTLWAMQTNWNGFFLAEPRFRAAVILATTGSLLQIGLSLLSRPAWTSLANLLFFVALWIVLRRAESVLHPPFSPIFGSGDASLVGYYIGVIFLTLAAAFFLTRWWLQRPS